MSTRTGRRAAAALAVVIATALAVGCEEVGDGGGAAVLAADSLTRADTTECGRQAMGFTTKTKRDGFIADCRRRLRMARAFGAESNREGELAVLIPEFHDEQRLANSPTEFGPMAMAFASPYLAGFNDVGQFVEHAGRPDVPEGGVLVAVVLVDNETDDPAPVGATYTRLGLERGLNCYWVSYVATRAPAWSAYVTHAAADTPCDAKGPRTPLAVVRTEYGQFARTPFDVPAVTRFTWDQDGNPLLGVRCGIAWCDIGPATNGMPRFTPRSRLREVWTAMSGEEKQAFRAQGGDPVAVTVPGWYDEQPLVEFNAAGVPVPGTLWASVIPAHRTYTPMRGIVEASAPPVALLWVHSNPAETRYGKAPWNLRQGANVISLRRETSGLVAKVTGAATSDFAGVAEVSWPNVHRHMHYDAPVISTARFRWSSADDGIWVACGQGCCRMDGEY